MISLLDAAAGTAPPALTSWFWADLIDLVHKASTGIEDTPRTLREQIVTSGRPVDTFRSKSAPRIPAPAPRTKTQSNPKPVLVLNMVEQILNYHARPLNRTELLKELASRDLVIGGYNPSKVLGTTLWRARDRFASIPQFGYWFAGRAYPPANYFPNGQFGADYD